MEKKRLIAGIVTGALLGVLCIIGGGIRLGFSGNSMLLAGMWYNRLVMGALIGFAFLLSTGFRDPVGLAAAMVYGLIIDIVSTKWEKNNKNSVLEQ